MLLESFFLSMTPSYCLLCFIWAAPTSNWAALGATLFWLSQLMAGLLLSPLLQVFSLSTAASLVLLLVVLPTPPYVSSTHVLSVSFFIHQSQFTGGRGQGTACIYVGTLSLGQPVLELEYRQHPAKPPTDKLQVCLTTPDLRSTMG